MGTRLRRHGVEIRSAGTVHAMVRAGIQRFGFESPCRKPEDLGLWRQSAPRGAMLLAAFPTDVDTLAGYSKRGKRRYIRRPADTGRNGIVP